MTKAKYDNPRSKVRGRPDGTTIQSSIPAKIAYSMPLQPGDVIEWIWTTEGYNSYAKVNKVTG
jgi:hypothetical protein